MANDDEKRKYVPIRQEKPNCFLWFFSPLVYTGRTPCITKECNLPNIHPLDTEGHLRPLLSIGWWFIRLLRRLLLPSIGVVHAAGPAQSSTKKEKECDPCRKLVRACDLPLYVEDGTKKCVDCVDTSAPPPEETIFTETIKCARKEIWFLMEQLKIVQKEVVTSLQSFREQSEDVVSFLREESNFAPRMGAIAVGGLTGYILALRRGIFRKLIYTTVGSTSIAALCYPKEAKAYSQDGFKIVKKYALIGYHFLNGDEGDNADCEKNEGKSSKECVCISKECKKHSS
ncbi:hypothetical protein O3M35_010521 [Rhynocoris fuscipes]|uniref:MICOS complex subunit n=1 Tax=Rhynocoris fuscipes TaxID=488301 RepID=A0AAW1CZI9_9HEMI